MAETEETVKYGTWIIIAVCAVVVLTAGITGAATGTLAVSSELIQKYLFFGTESIDFDVTTTTGQVGGLITALMVWIIIFVGFGDILENFSAFSKGIGWVMAFAISIVAANVGLIQAGVINLVKIFAWAGTAAMFLALFAAFVAFVAINFGSKSLFDWVKRRQNMIHAATGKQLAGEGFEVLTDIGNRSEKAGKKKKK